MSFYEYLARHPIGNLYSSHGRGNDVAAGGLPCRVCGGLQRPDSTVIKNHYKARHHALFYNPAPMTLTPQAIKKHAESLEDNERTTATLRSLWLLPGQRILDCSIYSQAQARAIQDFSYGLITTDELTLMWGHILTRAHREMGA